MTIKLITFKTNHTIIGQVEEKEHHFEVCKPLQVVSVPPSDKDHGGIAFVPFIEYAEEFRTGFTISKEDVLILSTPVTELENQYSSMFGSGIQIAHSIPKV